MAIFKFRNYLLECLISFLICFLPQPVLGHEQGKLIQGPGNKKTIRHCYVGIYTFLKNVLTKPFHKAPWVLVDEKFPIKTTHPFNREFEFLEYRVVEYDDSFLDQDAKPRLSTLQLKLSDNRLMYIYHKPTRPDFFSIFNLIKNAGPKVLKDLGLYHLNDKYLGIIGVESSIPGRIQDGFAFSPFSDVLESQKTLVQYLEFISQGLFPVSQIESYVGLKKNLHKQVDRNFLTLLASRGFSLTPQNVKKINALLARFYLNLVKENQISKSTQGLVFQVAGDFVKRYWQSHLNFLSDHLGGKSFLEIRFEMAAYQGEGEKEIFEFEQSLGPHISTEDQRIIGIQKENLRNSIKFVRITPWNSSL
jgi:hypothetical protein